MESSPALSPTGERPSQFRRMSARNLMSSDYFPRRREAFGKLDILVNNAGVYESPGRCYGRAVPS